MHVYRTACITFRTKCQSTAVQSISSSSTAGPGVPSDQRTCPQTKLCISSAVASSSTRGTSPMMPIIHWVPRRVHHGPTALRQHLENLIFHTEPYTGQIDGDHLLPAFFGIVCGQCPVGLSNTSPGNPRIIMGTVQTTIDLH